VQGLFGALYGDKCLGRGDLRCAKGADGRSACVPTCGSDAQCAGLRCDPRAAVCMPTPTPGLPTGATCDGTQVPTACAGLCLGFQTPVSMCSEPCVLGAASPDSLACGGADHGLCAWHPPANGVGDYGFCTPACVAQSDCQTPSFWCFGVPHLTEVVHNGYCFAATPCPHGQSDCEPAADAGPADAGASDGSAAGDAGGADAGYGYTCTQTTAGPFCLDPAFPLDSPDAGPGDAGPGDAGPGDAGPGDAGDAGPGDAGRGDAGPGDAGLGDSGLGDAGLGDAGGSADGGTGDGGGGGIKDGG
jgi:hypothetical protein